LYDSNFFPFLEYQLYFIFISFSGFPRVWNVSSLIQVHFKIILCWFTDGTNILQQTSLNFSHLCNIDTINLTYSYVITSEYIINILGKLLFARRSKHKNRRLYFAFIYSVTLFLWLCRLEFQIYHFSSLWRSSFNIYFKVHLLVANYFLLIWESFCFSLWRKFC
jgi:hypothetical protein